MLHPLYTIFISTNPMFKQLLATATTLGLLAASPAMAMVEGFDSQHQMLLDTLRAKGVYVALNVPQVCDAVKTNKSTHGVYFYNSNKDVAMMAICQDFGGRGEEVQWTANDLDTLRHESIHYLQDCMDGELDGEMVPLYDGPGGYSPIDLTIKDVVAAIGYEQATAIIATYTRNGASDEVIRLELEAFLSAAKIKADMIAKSIDVNCPAK